MNDDLGRRMKSYEAATCNQKLLVQIPVLARIDGRAFHSFTKGLNRPYDKNLLKLMQETTKFLVDHTAALVGYTQSDEISLLWLAQTYKSDIFFSGKVSKMVSNLSSLTTYFFNKEIPKYLPSKMDRPALFDARVFNVPNKTEACNYLIWREKDAVRNSIQMLGQANYSQKELHRLTCKDIKQKLLEEKNISWEVLPSSFKRGSYFCKEQVQINNVIRTRIVQKDFPIMTKISNREDVVFDGSIPLILEENK